MACIKSGEEYRWTSGIVPYLIDSTLADQERVTRAIARLLFVLLLGQMSLIM
ncbi:hypothetical protein [Bacillus sp. K2I17]|uniref:hypothetical protein n=1 Tax=Bacillus sp. K2I17 TaxID=2014743 RepID=UPI0015C5C214|nr:hypothetical protein [Bacillus sp. K2I17]